MLHITATDTIRPSQEGVLLSMRSVVSLMLLTQTYTIHQDRCNPHSQAVFLAAQQRAARKA